MLLRYIVWSLVLLSLYTAWLVRSLFSNIDEARRTGLPYVVLPVFPYSVSWRLTYRFWLPLLRKLPSQWTASWIE